MTRGPREQLAIRMGRPDLAVAWARIMDRWDLAHHNLFRASKDAKRSMERLHDAFDRDPDEREP